MAWRTWRAWRSRRTQSNDNVNNIAILHNMVYCCFNIVIFHLIAIELEYFNIVKDLEMLCLLILRCQIIKLLCCNVLELWLGAWSST
jgi:hypothetical protein